MSSRDGTPGHDFFIVGAFGFPHGDASAQRLLTLAQAAAAGGLRPLVINDDERAAPEDYVPGTVGTVGGIDFVCLQGPRGGRFRRLVHRATRPQRIARVIARHRISGSSPAVSVASGLCSLALLVGFRWGLRARVIADVVERHEASQFPRGYLEPYFVRHRWTSALARRLADGVIVISSRLADAYAGMRPAPLVVPPLVDLEGYTLDHRAPSVSLELLYVGNPRGKDQLGVVFDAIGALDPNERSQIQLTIAGADISALASNPDVGPDRVRDLDGSLSALGFVPRPRVLELLANADFTILFRPSGGYADAGFPTKVPESLAAGCPVLCNLTTDLGAYLIDGENAMVCPTRAGAREVQVDDLATTVRQALALTPEEKAAMKHAARRSADAFSTTAWGIKLVTWLEAVG